MMAFLVGSDVPFPFSGQVYTVMLPDGEPVQRTDDAFGKYGVAFSPDGSQITYTEVGGGWQVRLYRDGEEIESSVFPLRADLEPLSGRRRAYAEAQAFAQNWLASQ